jgi:hypothetical protein
MEVATRSGYSSTVAITALLPILVVWGGWGLWGMSQSELCVGECLEWIATGIAIALVAAGVGAAAAAAWAWSRHGRIAHVSPVKVGLLCAAVLLPLAFASGEIRAAVAARYFPYVIWFRFGYSGAILVWSLMSVIACGIVVGLIAVTGNKIVRPGPAVQRGR